MLIVPNGSAPSDRRAPGQPLDDLVDRAVAAADEDGRQLTADGLGGEAGGVPASSRLSDLQVPAEGSHGIGDAHDEAERARAARRAD